MTVFRTLAVGIMVVLPLWAGAAMGQSKPSCDQMKANSPQKVEGRVVRVDKTSGKVAISSTDGKTHEFQASKETLDDLKVGDSVQASLRSIPNC
jgi:hypothetical protein